MIFAFPVVALTIAVLASWLADIPMDVFMEDGVKLLGITAWAAYFVRVCHRVLTDGFLAPPDPEGPPEASRAS